MKTITVNVTFEDIAMGFAQDCRRCPIARAVGRHFPKAEIVASSGRIDVLFPDWVEDEHGVNLRMYRAYTPSEAYQFMVAYDSDQEVSALSFELNLYPHNAHTPPTRTVL